VREQLHGSLLLVETKPQQGLNPLEISCMEMKVKFPSGAVLEVRLWFSMSFEHPQLHKWSNLNLSYG